MRLHPAKFLMLGTLLSVATPSLSRDLSVPTDKGWQHARTGLILPAQLAGLSRTELTDATNDEFDVAAQFEDAGASVIATVYVFHPAIESVPVWFDRSTVTLGSSRLFSSAAPATPLPISFAAGGAAESSSLRQVFIVPEGPFKSTALAIVPVGDWLVSMRLSAKELAADQLDERLTSLIADVRWPASKGTAPPAAAPVDSCPAPLKFKKARQVKGDGADLLLTLVGGITAREKADKGESLAPVIWCREGDGQTDYSVYREAAGAGGYTIAIKDAGRAIAVNPSLMAQIDGKSTHSVSLMDVDGNVAAYPSFSSLPLPTQVWDVIANGSSVGSAEGDQINLNANSF